MQVICTGARVATSQAECLSQLGRCMPDSSHAQASQQLHAGSLPGLFLLVECTCYAACRSPVPVAGMCSCSAGTSRSPGAGWHICAHSWLSRQAACSMYLWVSGDRRRCLAHAAKVNHEQSRPEQGCQLQDPSAYLAWLRARASTPLLYSASPGR